MGAYRSTFLVVGMGPKSFTVLNVGDRVDHLARHLLPRAPARAFATAPGSAGHEPADHPQVDDQPATEAPAPSSHLWWVRSEGGPPGADQ